MSLLTQTGSSSCASDWSALLGAPDVDALLRMALDEDVGSGDVTTGSIFTVATPVVGEILTRGDTIVCGLPLAAEIFRRVDAGVTLAAKCGEGEPAAAGFVIAEVRGDVRGILTAERCVLNFLMRLCGIATAAYAASAAIPENCRARIYDTRKTTPGWRTLDKAAVRIGGAHNHRVGLFDAVLIKDNHVAAAGSVGEAVRRARAHVGHSMPVEVEIDALDQLDEALAAGPDIVLLDNFSDDQMREAVTRTAGRAELEASGGITLARIPDVARTGVDRISLGALTHTVLPADLSLELRP